jgi:hypothetical protein
MCLLNQAPRTDWELNLGFIPALFAVRITEAATIHMVHMMLFVSLKIVIESMQTNSWILELMWIHLQVARSVVSFLCLRICLRMQDLNLVFILWDLDQYPRVSFLKELNSDLIPLQTPVPSKGFSKTR